MKRYILIFFVAAQAKIERKICVGGFIQRTISKKIDQENECIWTEEEHSAVQRLEPSEKTGPIFEKVRKSGKDSEHCPPSVIVKFMGLPYDASEQYRVCSLEKGASLEAFGMKEDDDQRLYKAVAVFGPERFRIGSLGPIAKRVHATSESLPDSVLNKEFNQCIKELSDEQRDCALGRNAPKDVALDEKLMQEYYSRIVDATQKMMDDKIMWAGGGVINAFLSAPVRNEISVTGGLLGLVGTGSKAKLYANINIYCGLKVKRLYASAYIGGERNNASDLKNNFVYGVFLSSEIQNWQIGVKIGGKKNHKGIDAALVITKNITWLIN